MSVSPQLFPPNFIRIVQHKFRNCRVHLLSFVACTLFKFSLARLKKWPLGIFEATRKDAVKLEKGVDRIPNLGWPSFHFPKKNLPRNEYHCEAAWKSFFQRAYIFLQETLKDIRMMSRLSLSTSFFWLKLMVNPPPIKWHIWSLPSF